MTGVYVALLGAVVALLLLLGRGPTPEPEPLRWDDIPVCLDCGSVPV